MSDQLSGEIVSPDLGTFLGVAGPTHGHQTTAAYASDSQPDQQNVSIAGVMLLTAISVTIAIAGIFALALFVIAFWWVAVHIPVPPIVTLLLSKLG